MRRLSALGAPFWSVLRRRLGLGLLGGLGAVAGASAAPPPAWTAYAQALSASLAAELAGPAPKAEAARLALTGAGQSSIEMSLCVTAQGRVERVVLLTPASVQVQTRILAAVKAARVPPPPADMPLPIRLRLSVSAPAEAAP